VTLLSLSGVTVQFGAVPLLTDVGFNVSQGERWGVVGRNGTGKTSLLRIILGTLEPEAGSVSRRPGLEITLLDQYREFGTASTVWEAAAAGFADLVALEQSLAREARRLGALGNGVTNADLHLYDQALERFHHRGGYAFHAKVDEVLQGLGFDPQGARDRPVAELSGGERGRVGLAAQLAAPADLVLLDEPTNHLDLQTIEWLKQHLKESGKTVIVISHDRAFLDDFTDHILHLSRGSAVPYKGGYSSFVVQRDRALLTLERKAEEQKKEVARQEDFIRRNIAGQKTAQAKSRRNLLARLPRLSPPVPEEDPMGVRFELSNRGGDQVLAVESLSVRVGERVLLEGFSAVARRGDVIALVGPNGSGKTTLLATLLGHRQAWKGKLGLGAGIQPAWYQQDHAHLPPNRTVYDCIADARPTWNRGQIQDHLGRFGFSGDEVKRTTDSLSGGERARVALALITVQGSNLLALDEPTNHLDVESIEALEDALDRYPGTVLLVSHDRALLRELATRVWAFKERGLQDFPGPFVDWEEKEAEERRSRARERLEAERSAKAEDRAQLRRETEARRERAAPLRKARRSAAGAEEKVTEAEERVAGLERALADPDLYAGSPKGAADAARLNQQLKEARLELDRAMAHWAECVEILERLEEEASSV